MKDVQSLLAIKSQDDDGDVIIRLFKEGRVYISQKWRQANKSFRNELKHISYHERKLQYIQINCGKERKPDTNLNF